MHAVHLHQCRDALCHESFSAGKLREAALPKGRKENTKLSVYFSNELKMRDEAAEAAAQAAAEEYQMLIHSIQPAESEPQEGAQQQQ